MMMLVSGYIAQLCITILYCSLGLCNCLHMCLKIKFNNNNNHAPFLETHGNSVRLGRSGYAHVYLVVRVEMQP